MIVWFVAMMLVINGQPQPKLSAEIADGRHFSTYADCIADARKLVGGLRKAEAEVGGRASGSYVCLGRMTAKPVNF